jgi:hypothetical protein
VTEGDLHELQREVKLKLIWSLNPSGAADAIPSRRVLLPLQLEQLLGEPLTPVLKCKTAHPTRAG